jgi:hypothetical protein
VIMFRRALTVFVTTRPPLSTGVWQEGRRTHTRFVGLDTAVDTAHDCIDRPVHHTEGHVLSEVAAVRAKARRTCSCKHRFGMLACSLVEGHSFRCTPPPASSSLPPSLPPSISLPPARSRACD